MIFNMPPRKNYCYALLIVGCLACVCKPVNVFAQTFLGAAPEALGLAGRAALNPLEAHYLNPAALSFLQSYYVGGTYKSDRGQLGNPENAYNLVIIDNSSERLFSASFGYLYDRKSAPDNTIVDQDFSISLAAKVLPTASIGLQGRRLVRAISNGPSFTKHNLTFGVLVVPASFLGLAFVAYDILDDADQDMIPTLSLGSHILILNILRLRADVTRQEKKNPDKKGSLNLGMEIDLSEGFLLRTGGAWDTLNHKTYWTGGLAWEGPKLSLAYAYRSEVETTGDIAHTVQAWLTF